MTKPYIGRGFTLSIENADGEFVPIGEVAHTRIIRKGTIELTGTVAMAWVDRWKLMAHMARPL